MVKSINDVEEKQFSRISTGVPDFDELIGISCIDRIYGGQFYIEAHIERGLPRGCISLWSGEPGVGKSRIITQIAKNINSKGECILVFPGEMPEEQYKSSAGYIRIPNIYYISDSRVLSEQLDIIDEIQRNNIYGQRPTLVIIDSINMLEGFNSSNGLRDIIEKYKKKANEMNCHVAFISHQNKEGDVKGNTDLPHLVDNVFMLNKFISINGEKIRFSELKLSKITKDELKSIFYVEVGKNRGGKTGGIIYFKHTDDGIEECGYNIDIAVPQTQVIQNPTVQVYQPGVGVDVNLQGQPINFFDRLFFNILGK
jgi:predicted ATP-dependent serine protease